MDQNLFPASTRPQPDAHGLVASGPHLQAGRLYLLIAPRPAVDRLMDALAVRLALAAAGRLGVESRQPYLHILDGGNRFDLHAIARGLAGGVAGGLPGNHVAKTGDMDRGNSEVCTRISRIDTDQVINPYDPYQSVYQPPAGSLLVEAILRRIRVARAFTCYQMEALLAGVAECRGESEPIEANGFGAGSPSPAADAGLSAPVLAPGLLTTFADENVRLGERLRVLQRCLQDLKRLAQCAPVLVSVTPPPAGAGAAGFLPHLEAAADQVWRFEAQPDNRSRPAGARPTVAPGQLRLFQL
jgi:hypothetical protein